MSNIKEVYIEVRAPWDWASKLPDSEAACFASVALNIIHGLNIEQSDDGYDPVPETGGRCHMVRIILSGEEGCSFGFLDRLASALATVGEVKQADARDIEDGGGWRDLRTNVPRPLPCEGCGVLVSPRPDRDDPGTGVFTALMSWSFTHEGNCPVREEIQNDPEIEAMQPRVRFGKPRRLSNGVTEVTAEIPE